MICGHVLQYQDQASAVTCSYCQKTEAGYIVCPNGHYVCESCHNQGARRQIEALMLAAKSTDSQEIAELAFLLPGLPMLGCQHAFIAAGALMAALRNEGRAQLTDADLREALERTGKQAQGGYCGLTGVCGIAPAIGACIAVLTGSRCGKDREQRLTMEAATRAARAITDLTGPSCCKAYVRASLSQAVEFIREKLKIDLPGGRVAVCRFGHKHPHGCRKTNCPYFGR